MKFITIIVMFLLVGCAPKVPEIKPSSPVEVNPVYVDWKVIADVRDINGKKYMVMPFDGKPYIALSYQDSLRFRSWMNDVKRYKNQSDILLCYYGHVDKCRPVEDKKK